MSADLKQKRRADTILGIGTLLLAAGLGFLVFNAIPDSHGRPGMEKGLMKGALRGIQSGESAYASATNGSFGPISCLQQPTATGCIPGYPTSAPIFADREWAKSFAQYSYEWKFVSGKPTFGSNFDRYCLQARPSRAYEKDAESFAVDSTGAMGQAQGIIECCGSDGTLLPACPTVPF